MADRYAIVVARFYAEVAERLVAGARAVFESDGHAVDVHDVPGAFELPLAASYAADSGRYRGIACLGVVIRGETDHYEYVCAEAARGILDVGLRSGVPCSPSRRWSRRWHGPAARNVIRVPTPLMP